MYSIRLDGMYYVLSVGLYKGLYERLCLFWGLYLWLCLLCSGVVIVSTLKRERDNLSECYTLLCISWKLHWSRLYSLFLILNISTYKKLAHHKGHILQKQLFQ